MNEKYYHAIRHSMASLSGWLRLNSKSPGFACELFGRRWRYFSKRQFEPFVAPDGFVFSTPDSLVGYWTMFVERELSHKEWVGALKTAQQPLVVDVGANAGLFSHFVFCLNPKTEIIAFEPLPKMQEHLKVLHQRTNMNFRCIPKAAGRTPGTAILESLHGYDGTSRISTDVQPTGKTFQVEVTTVDNELANRQVLVMKIDVEGFEEEVIAGAQATLSRTKFVIIEAHDIPRRDLLTQLLGPSWIRHRLGVSDYLFSRI
ncbi:MAG TPA: FkbM family methyltransferase [Verrucomicrobiae bacterium]|jgi:FkbM family methyltransferase